MSLRIGPLLKLQLHIIVLFIVMVVFSVSSFSATHRGAPQLPGKLRVAVVQMDIRETIEENRDYIVGRILTAARKNARVVVFPERALSGTGGDRPINVEGAIAAIKRAAVESNVYAIFGGFTYSNELDDYGNWMLAIGPNGKELFRYEKIYNNHHARMPGVFVFDGIPCSGMICADRWLRGVEEIPIQEGAKISFELANNFGAEWIEPLGWYWYVPRALRNTVWVVFANSGKGNYTWPYTPVNPYGHGHSAIISPDGSFAGRANDNDETIVMADIDAGKATRAEALARSGHPALHEFWQAGIKEQRGQAQGSGVPFTPFKSEKKEIRIAVAQLSGGAALIEKMVSKAKAENADLIAFPERAMVSGTAITEVKAIARKYAITMVIGSENVIDGRLRNSAYVFGPDGSLLTRYDQLSAHGKYEPGVNPGDMWFRVKGVPAVVTIGRDALWTEVSELAAVAGAQIHIHLDHRQDYTPEENLRRLQILSIMASYRTFTAVADLSGSTFWEDFNTSKEIRAVLDGKERPDTGKVEIYSPWSANLIMQSENDSLITVTTHNPGINNFHPKWTSNFNPQMENWYRIGAKIIQSNAEVRMENY